jgi:hypothetical protein
VDGFALDDSVIVVVIWVTPWLMTFEPLPVKLASGPHAAAMSWLTPPASDEVV